MTTTVLREGTFFSESHVIEGFVKKRYMVLERTHGGKDGAEGAVRIIVFDSKQIADRNLYAQPGFSSPFVHVWNLESGMKVTEVENKGFRMRDQTSRARRKEFVVVPLYYFTLHLSGGSTPWKRRSVKLCFEREEDAQAWYGEIKDILQYDPSRGQIAHESIISSLESRLGPREVEEEEDEHPWETFLHVNGISIYSEKAEMMDFDDEPAVMSSVVIRSSPRSCLKSLLVSGSNDTRVGGVLAFSDTIEVIQALDPFTSIIKLTWSTTGILGYVFSSREAVLLRTWRMQEDGTYVVTYQPAPPAFETSQKTWIQKLFGIPVKADIYAAGFTIAPLRQEYIVQGDDLSQESLVTLVVKADAAGSLVRHGLLSKVLPSLTAWLRMTLMQPLLMSLILLRDRLEQSRFVVMPSMLSHDEEEEGLDHHVHAQQAEVHEPKKVTVHKLTVPEPAVKIFGKEGCCDPKFWSFPGSGALRIRGKTYLKDKVKIQAKPPVFDLYSSDLIDSDELLWHVARGLPSVQLCDAPYAFVLNLLFPNSPLQSLVTVWTCRVDPTEHSVDELVDIWEENDTDGSLRAFFTNYKAWAKGSTPADDARRNTKFKLIPRVPKGSWVVRQSVGTTPVLLGQKLNSKYFKGRTPRGCSYLEVDVDITSNSVANTVTKLVVNSITSLVVDLSPLIEGQSPEELPERLIGCVRYDHLDLKTAASWDKKKQTIVPRCEGKGC